jgi:hypothetical protein
MDVGLEERLADLPQAGANIGLGEIASSTQAPKYLREPLGQ